MNAPWGYFGQKNGAGSRFPKCSPKPGTRTTVFWSIREAEERRGQNEEKGLYFTTPDAPGVW